jgi:[ribosomal protein S5]-alanine N-acetyltransferase
MTGLTVETGRLRLRPMEPGDARALFEIYRDPQTAKYWNKPDRSVADSQLRIAAMLGHWERYGFGDWALTDKRTGAMIGFCGLHHIERMAEVNLGFLLRRDFWGRGLATEASLAALDFGFEKAGVPAVVGTVAPGNAAAIRVLEACGMSLWKTIERDGPRLVFMTTRDAWGRASGVGGVA